MVRVEQVRRDFERKRLEMQVRVEQRAVEYYTKHEARYAEGNDIASNTMRVWCKKKRKKHQADLDWARAKLAEFNA